MLIVMMLPRSCVHLTHVYFCHINAIIYAYTLCNCFMLYKVLYEWLPTIWINLFLSEH